MVVIFILILTVVICSSRQKQRVADDQSAQWHLLHTWVPATIDSTVGLPDKESSMGVAVTAVVLLLAALAVVSVGGAAVEECRLVKDVGLWVPNDRMTASSVNRDCFPYLGRLNDDDGCGAWCPASDVRSSSNEWLEINLGRLANISYIETQGRFAMGKGSEYTPAYRLQYDRGDGRGLVWYVEPVATGVARQTTEFTVLSGNSDSHSSDFRRMPWLMARRVRFLPYTTSATGQPMCMRVRLNGCYTDGVVAYNVTPAPTQGDLLSVSDVRFDGLTLPPNVTTGSRGGLVRGLGLLTDGHLAANFPALSNGGKRGSGWVGWREASAHDNVTLTFEFDELRNFTKIRVHTSNQFQNEVRMFRHAAVAFSADGAHYGTSGPEYFLTQADSASDQPRNIEFGLAAGRLGRFVKLQLFFNAKWILISEVGFDSTIVSPSNLTVLPFPPPPATTMGEPAGETVTDGGREQPEQQPAAGQQLDNQTIGIIAGATAGAVMLIICLAVILCLCCRRRAEKQAGSSSGHYVDQHFVLQSGFKPERGAAAAQAVPTGTPSYPSLPAKDGTYEEPWGRTLPQLPMTGLPGNGGGLMPNGYMSDGAGSVSDYAVIPDVGPQAMLLPPAHPAPYRPAGTSYRPPHQSYASGRSLMVGCSSIQGASGSSLFGMPTREQQPPLTGVDDQPIVELPYSKLHFLEKLGEGQFGEVHLCEIAADMTMAGGCGQLLAVDEGIDDGVGCLRVQPLLVACKLLKLDAGEAARKDFQREIKILSRLRDPNIVRVLGMCRSEGSQPLCVIVEYMQFGDLHQFLRKHGAPDGSSTLLLHSLTRDSGCGRDAPPSYSSANSTLSRGSLIYMASQVASGMKYLESLNMVHRDLAARNVLVGSLYSVKISDFGMSRRLYSSDYYRVEGRVVLPIRWMAWESILLGRFTTRSDVWSFGVLLWELFTFALEPPYRHWSDEQVIENCVQFRNVNGMAVVLDKPDYCPREVYDLMRACWNAEDSSRPPFKDIHLFLAHKNAGYDPLHDHSDAHRRRGSTTRTLDDEVFMATDC